MISPQIRAIRAISTSDVVYVRWHFAALPTAILARAVRTPLVVEVNGTTEDVIAAWPSMRRFHGVIDRAGRWVLRLADGIVAVTEGLAQWAAASGAHRTVVVPNGVDVDRFAPAQNPPCLDDDPRPYVAFVGALAPWQGVEVMVDALGHPSWPDDVALVVAGDGVLRELCLESRGHGMRYLGPISHDAVPALLAGAIASISVQTGRSGRAGVGCSPIKLYEGLACGRPVIATDVPGVGEVVGECGIVIPPDNPAALAEAVSELARDPSRADAMGKRARDAAVALHSWDTRARATARFLAEVWAA